LAVERIDDPGRLVGRDRHRLQELADDLSMALVQLRRLLDP